MKPARRAWLLVAVLWAVACLNYVDRQLIFSVFPLLEADLKLSGTQLGLLSTSFLWIYGLLSPVSGFLADRYGRKRVIFLSLLVWSAVTWSTGHVHNFTQLLWARGLMGVSEAFYLPAALALIAGHHGERTRSLATGIHSSGIYAGMVLGGVGGGWLGERYGWRLGFTLLGAAGIAYLVVLGLSFRSLGGGGGGPDPPPKPRFLSSMEELLGLSGFVSLTLVFIATSIANWMIYTWLPLYLYERFGMSLTKAGFSATVYIQAASAAGIVAGGWLADRWSGSTPRGRLYTQSLGLIAAAPFLFVIGLTASLPLLVAAFLVFGFGKGLYDCNTMPVLCQIARPELRSTGYGIFNFAGCLAGGVVAPLAGSLKTTLGIGGAFQVAGILLLLSVVLLLRTRLGDAALKPASRRAVAGN